MAVPVAAADFSPYRKTTSEAKAAVPFLVFFVLLVMAGLTANNWSILVAGQLVGNDDYMRLVQVRDWLAGAGWYQVDQPRLGYPQGTPMHWARVVDLPLAAVIATLTPLLGATNAELAAVILVPGSTFAVIVAGVVWAARPLAQAPGPILAGAGVGLLPMVVAQIAPGRIDHHGWQFAVAVLMLGAAIRLVDRPTARTPLIVAIVAGSLGIWIGQEAVPWILAIHVVLGLAWIGGRREVAIAGSRLGIGLVLGSIAMLVLAQPPDVWLTPACDALSTVTVGLMLAALAPWAAVWLLELAAPRTAAAAGSLSRCAIIVLAGVAALGALIAAFPACSGGFFGDTDPGYRAFLDQIVESRPLLAAISATPGWGWSAVSAMGLGASALAIAVLGGARRRRLWFVVAVFFGIAVVGTVAQIRMGGFLQLFAAIPLGIGAGMVWRFVGRFGLVLRVFGRVASLLALLAISLPAILLGDSAGADATETPAETAPCDVRAIVPVLDDLAGPDRRLLVAGNLDLAAPLLHASRHAVLGGPYHRGADGALATNRLLAETRFDAALSLVRDRRVDVILICPGMGLVSAPEPGSLIRRLLEGAPPAWLDPVPLPAGSPLRLFRVRDEAELASLPEAKP